MVQKTILFVVSFGVFLFAIVAWAGDARAAFDCLTLTSSSSEMDKNYCRNELVQIEVELQDLLNKQKEQQKHTGTLKGDVNFLNSQIKALQTKVKARDRKSTRLNSSHSQISYAVFCL